MLFHINIYICDSKLILSMNLKEINSGDCLITVEKDNSVHINLKPSGIFCRRTIVFRGRIAKPGYAMFVITGPNTKRGKPQLVQEFKTSNLSEQKEQEFRNELILKFIETFNLQS